MTSKILQLVNSAYFSLPRHISSPEHAVIMLGLDVVKSLVIVIQVFKKFERLNMPKQFFDRLWSHNVITGKLAKEIAKTKNQNQTIIDNAFIAGLLHDSGKLVLASSFPEKYRKIADLNHGGQDSVHGIECEIFGITHSEIGAYLMGIWGLPIPIIEAIAFHHSPARCNEMRFSPLTAVYIANILEHANIDTEINEYDSIFDSAYMSDMNLNNSLRSWLEIMHKIPNGDC